MANMLATILKWGAAGARLGLYARAWMARASHGQRSFFERRPAITYRYCGIVISLVWSIAGLARRGPWR